jgi:surface polysaccharide O-acyltransferase-like enzyme
MARSERSVWDSARSIGLRRTRADAYRVYAMLVVIVGHSEMALGPAGAVSPSWIQLGLNVVGRVAVPLFLLLAGNHLGPKMMRHRGTLAAMWPYMRRLLVMLVVASVFYWAWDAFRLIRRSGLAAGLAAFVAKDFSSPLAILCYGARPHLWFLVALVLTVLFAAMLLGLGRVRTFLSAAALLYVVGLLIGPYADALVIRNPYVGSDWFLQAPLFFGMGLMLSFEELRARWSPVGWAFLLGGLALHGLETWWISQTFGTWPFDLEMLVGTVPFAFGAGLLALRAGGTAMDRLFAQAAFLVPAVYLNHVFFLELFRPPRTLADGLWVRIALPAIVVPAAFGAAWLNARIRARRRARRRSAAASDPAVA